MSSALVEVLQLVPCAEQFPQDALLGFNPLEYVNGWPVVKA